MGCKVKIKDMVYHQISSLLFGSKMDFGSSTLQSLKLIGRRVPKFNFKMAAMMAMSLSKWNLLKRQPSLGHMLPVMVKNLDETVELLIIFKFHKTQAKCLSKLTLIGLNSRNQ